MAARRRKRWKKILPTITLTVIPFVWNPPAANAFFPPIVTPPIVTPPIVVPPVIPPPFIPPPVIPPVIVPPVVPPPVITPPDPCHCHPNPSCVPEPMTIISSLFGLAAVAGYRMTRGRAEKGDGAKESDSAEGREG